MTRRVLLLILVLAIVWLAPSVASASAPFVFQTDMYGSSVVPPVQTGAWGFVRFFFNDDRSEADYTVDVKGLSGSLVEGADLRFGRPGTDGPVVRHLAGAGFIVTSGKLRLTAQEIGDLAAGNYYVTLYTREHPEGELRGQVYVPGGFLPGTTSNGPQGDFAGIPVPTGQTPKPAPDGGAVSPAPPEDETHAPPPPPPASRPGITPPNTGDAGLVERARGASTTAVLAPAVALVILCVFAAGPAYRRR